MSETPKHVTYEDAGVDTAEGGRAVDAIKQMVASTNRPEVIGGIGGFGGLFSAAALKDMDDPVLISGTDGVGTKLVLAQILDRHETVGQDLVAMCVNDILACGAEPLFFLDYIAIGKLRREHVANVVGGIAEGCRQAGCALIGGEMAEHPGVMDPDDYDLSGFTVGVVDRPKMIGPDGVCEGDVLIGLKSSGFHSNGYSLVRRVLVEGKTADELSAPCDELGGRPLGEALLAPTRIYVKPVLELLERVTVRGISHITGGGFYENIPRSLREGLSAKVDKAAVKTPPVFEVIAREGGIPERDMFNTFNMGVGMSVIVPADEASAALDVLRGCGVEAYAFGELVEGDGGVILC